MTRVRLIGCVLDTSESSEQMNKKIDNVSVYGVA